jgi:DNA-binding transcriptional ArsR family regulator
MADPSRSALPSGRLDPVVLRDPRAIKALAHPARLAVIEEFFNGRKLTATECADISGLSASAMSYHLRALERWGLVRRSQASGDGRERPWEAAGHGLRIESDEPRASATGEATLIARILDRQRAEALDWIGRGQLVRDEWDDLMTLTNSSYWLTADEAQELSATLIDTVHRFERQRPDDATPGTRRVRISVLVIPTEQHTERSSRPDGGRGTATVDEPDLRV